MIENLTPHISDADALDVADDNFDYAEHFAATYHPPRDYDGLPMWTDALVFTDDEWYELQELRRLQSTNQEDIP